MAAVMQQKKQKAALKSSPEFELGWLSHVHVVYREKYYVVLVVVLWINLCEHSRCSSTEG
jgi:hypothetical protein